MLSTLANFPCKHHVSTHVESYMSTSSVDPSSGCRKNWYSKYWTVGIDIHQLGSKQKIEKNMTFIEVSAMHPWFRQNKTDYSTIEEIKEVGMMYFFRERKLQRAKIKKIFQCCFCAKLVHKRLTQHHRLQWRVFHHRLWNSWQIAGLRWAENGWEKWGPAKAF